MKKRYITLFLAALCVSVTACGASDAGSEGNTENTDIQSSTDNAGADTNGSDTAGSGSSVAANISGILDTDSIFTERDLAQEADVSGAQGIEVSDGETIDITDEGVYLITGEAKNCTIKVNAGDKDKVQLVLDGVTVTNDNFPVIYVVEADKCFVTTTEQRSSLTVTDTFTSDGDTDTDAVVFAKQDLTLNGTGSLEITSTQNAVTAKDDLKITGGTYSINAGKHAFEANDSISVSDGVFEIKCTKDGFNCGNNDDETVGWTYISGGSVNIDSSSDGISTASLLQVDGGNIDITSAEGLEATYIQINAGNISINASDDGINATDKCNGQYKIGVEFNGGKTDIVMGSGDVDGVDSNGSIYVNGGTVNVTISEAGMSMAFDFDETAEINGGEVFVNGEKITEITASTPGGMTPPDKKDVGKGF